VPFGAEALVSGVPGPTKSAIVLSCPRSTGRVPPGRGAPGAFPV